MEAVRDWKCERKFNNRFTSNNVRGESVPRKAKVFEVSNKS